MKKMNILVAVNDSFVIPTRVMLMSLRMNHSQDIFIDVFILFSTLERNLIDLFMEFNSNEMRINFLKVNDSLFDNVPLFSYFSKEVYYRLEAQELLPENIERILWLDGDTIINGSLEKFYFQEIGDSLLVAHEDMLNGQNRLIHEKFGIPMCYAYFSSGVMLYNLKEMRKRVRVSQIFDFIKKNASKLQIVDQDVLNAMFYRNVKIWGKPYTYNFFAAYITRRNRRDVFNNISIIHYCGSKKPWEKSYPYYGFRLFWKYGLLFEEYKNIYKEIKVSAFMCHIKWLIYEEIKLLVGHFISLDKLKNFFRRKG